MPPAKRKPARRSTTARRRKPAARKHPTRRVKIPRGGPIHARLGSWLVLRVVVPMVDTHKDTVTAREAAAIRRITHDGCTVCHGNGQVHTRNKKTGELSGSKPCPAPGTKEKASRLAVYKASRFGANKTSGLIGWSCKCGKKEKPRFQDAAAATKALRAHEQKKHGGKSVGGAWYAQATEGTAQAPTQQQAAPVTKTNTGKTMTDTAWEKQNKPPSAAKAAREGLCRSCTDGALYSAFGGEQITAVCPFCHGSGKSPAKTNA